MIISALAHYYDQLLSDPKSGVAAPGWCSRQVKYLLELSLDGTLVAVVPLGDGNHGASRIVPEQVKRSSGIAPNFICDTSSYLLGVDAKGKPERSMKCFEAAKVWHEEVLAESKGEVATAILNFFNRWDPANVDLESIPGLADEGVLAGGNLAFCLADGASWREAVDDQELKAAWEARSAVADGQSEMVSLATGKKSSVARLHPSIKGVKGAQPMGASLVGFNAESFESYGHAGEQGRNAPVDQKSTQAYATALNYLLTQPMHRGHLGDTTVVFWSDARDSDKENCSILSFALGLAPFEDKITEEGAAANLKAAFESLSVGKKIDADKVSFGDEFFLLGLAPNAARLSVRFFLHDTFGEMMRHVLEHYWISNVCPANFDTAFATPYRLLKSIENSNSKSPVISSQLSASLMRSILQGARYPEALFENVLLRVRAEKEVKREHAAIIRSYLIRNAKMDERDVTVDVNISRESEAYALGRAFAVLEQIQEAANGKSTIAERYLNAACATPAMTFPVLLKLSVAHLSKISRDKLGLSVHLEKTLGELLEQQKGSFPKRLSIVDQGNFLLGYYQQKQARYKKSDQQES